MLRNAHSWIMLQRKPACKKQPRAYARLNYNCPSGKLASIPDHRTENQTITRTAGNTMQPWQLNASMSCIVTCCWSYSVRHAVLSTECSMLPVVPYHVLLMVSAVCNLCCKECTGKWAQILNANAILAQLDGWGLWLVFNTINTRQTGSRNCPETQLKLYWTLHQARN